MKMNKILKIFIILINYKLFATDCSINIFDVGQGNCVLIRYNNEAVLIDAGSKELGHSAYYNSKYVYDQDEPKYFLTSQEGNFSENFLLSETVNTDVAPNKNKEEKKNKEKIKKDYKEYIVKSILDLIPTKSTTGQKFLKTLIISHPDEDHSNWIPEIFKNDFYIDNAIFGGLFVQYLDIVKNWINMNKKNIKNLIFTGTFDGSHTEKIRGYSYLKDYARPYCSNSLTYTTIEKRIEESLVFNPISNEAPSPVIEILSMNAGHVLNPNTNYVYIANPDTNTNSTVIRVRYHNISFLVPGDANEGTWNHILSNYTLEDLQTDYVLLSHHGAVQGGCNSEMILNLLNPKVCFISSGRRNGYNHPRGEVVDIIKNLKSLITIETNNYISYFRQLPNQQIVYKRLNTEKAIFSTQDYGTLSFNLEKKININYGRARESMHLRFIKTKSVRKSISTLEKIAEEINNGTIDRYIFIFQLIKNDKSNDVDILPLFKMNFIRNKDYYLIDRLEKKVFKIELLD
jgi:beta-lactamase superfamily II metal-dependent hydrolase